MPLLSRQNCKDLTRENTRVADGFELTVAFGTPRKVASPTRYCSHFYPNLIKRASMKKSIHSTIWAAASLTILLFAHAVYADTEKVGDYTWTYRINGDEAEIYGIYIDTVSGGYTPAISPLPSGAVTIPSTLGGKLVASIGDHALGGCSRLTSVTIPNGVTSIGCQAFDDCDGLMSVTIPNGVTSIGEMAFYHCNALKSVTIPNSVTNIGDYAFGDCFSLSRVTMMGNCPSVGWGLFDGVGVIYLPDGNATYDVVDGKWRGRNVEYYDLSCNFTIVDGVLTGGPLNGATDVVIPSSVTSIGSYAFYGRSDLTSVTIPDSVTSIGQNAFYGCDSIRDVSVPQCVSDCQIRDVFPSYSSITNVVILDSVTSIGNNAFYGCSDLTNVTIPDGVTSIGASAFSGCSGLTSLTIPDGVTNIGASAFSGCSGLTSVTIPDGVTSIANSVFYCCSGLTSVTIPDSVTEIGDHAFYGCSSLKTLSIPAGSVESYGADCFEGCPAYALQLYRSIFGSGATSGGGADAVTLTVTNVVVHYVTASVPSTAVTPTEQTGFVNIIAEVSAGGPVAISSTWAEQYEGFVAKFGSDFTAALTKPTGKRDGAGNEMRVWQDYVAGTDPTKEEDVFTASITFDGDGKPVISYTPELSATEAAKRTYRTFGKVKLNDKDWIEIVDGEEDNYNFFKVTVEMK